MSTNTQKPTFISRLAHGIVFWRQIILILCLALVVFSVIAIPWVEVDESFTSYLDAESETRRGISIMEEEFATYATAQIMVDDVSPNEAQAYADRIGTIDGVAMVTFDFTEQHYIPTATHCMTYRSPRARETRSPRRRTTMCARSSTARRSTSPPTSARA